VRFRSAGIATRRYAKSVRRSSAWLATSNGTDEGKSGSRSVSQLTTAFHRRILPALSLAPPMSRSLFRVARYVEWCGHGQKLIPVPDEGEWVRMVPIIGTAK